MPVGLPTADGCLGKGGYIVICHEWAGVERALNENRSAVAMTPNS